MGENLSTANASWKKHCVHCIDDDMAATNCTSELHRHHRKACHLCTGFVFVVMRLLLLLDLHAIIGLAIDKTSRLFCENFRHMPACILELLMN